MIIRKAELKDLNALLDIYNYEVVNETTTLDIHPKTYRERLEWFNEHNKENHPLITAEKDGKVIGYASLSPYREKEAYKTTVELSLYVGKENRRRGVAAALMSEIISMARADKNIHSVISIITSENNASIKLHEKFGFVYVGKIHNAAVKFNRFLDIDCFELPV